MLSILLPRRRALLLTQDEALALLEMCALTLVSERQAHGAAISRLGEFCRGFETYKPRTETGEVTDGRDRRHSAPVQEACLA